MWLKKILKLRKSDNVLFKNVYNFYNYFAFFTITNRKKLMLIIPVYLVLLVSFVMVNTSSTQIFEYSYVSLIIYICYLATLILFSLVCLKNVCFGHGKLWNILFSNIEEFDSTMGGQTISFEKSLLKYYSKYILSNSVFSIFFSCLYYDIVKSLNIHLYLAIIFGYLVFNQVMITISYLQDIFKILEKRYEFLICKIREVYSSINEVEVVWNGQQFRRRYLLLHTNIHKINEIFGQRILLIIAMAMFYLLTMCQLGIIDDKETKQFLPVSVVVIFLVSRYIFFVRI